MTSLCLLIYTEVYHIASTNKALTYVLNMELCKAYFSTNLVYWLFQLERVENGVEAVGWTVIGTQKRQRFDEERVAYKLQSQIKQLDM